MTAKLKVIMKPCAKNRGPIAWMAAGVLDTANAETLRQHLRECAGCRHYWESLSALSKQLESVTLPQPELPDSFHRRLVRRIGEHNSPPFGLAAAVQRFFGERWLATATVALAFAAIGLVLGQRFNGKQERVSRPVVVRESTREPRRPILRPTLGTYHQAANTSLESLDALLARQTPPTAPAVESFTVSSLLAQSIED